jgi:hypothetical protein
MTQILQRFDRLSTLRILGSIGGRQLTKLVERFFQWRLRFFVRGTLSRGTRLRFLPAQLHVAQGVDGTRNNAVFKGGVMTVRLGKAETATAKAVEIKVAERANARRRPASKEERQCGRRLPFCPNMVEAAGVEPASLPDKPAATTCLVRRECQPVNNVLTRIHRSSPHAIVSAKTARTPALA